MKSSYDVLYRLNEPIKLIKIYLLQQETKKNSDRCRNVLF